MEEQQGRKPMVDGMYTRHTDYKHGRPKLTAAEGR